MSPTQAAKYLGVTRGWIVQLTAEGKLPAIKTAIGHLYRAEDLDRYQSERRPAGRPVEPSSARQLAKRKRRRRKD